MSLSDPLTNPLASPLTVTTDYSDYAPGQTAVLTANNVALGSAVEFSVTHVLPGADGILGTADDELSHDLSGTTSPWTIIDGGVGDLDGIANGQIVTSWYVNIDALEQNFLLSATDSTGATATASFTDATETDLRAAGSSTTIGGVIFRDSANIGSGTGGYNTFLALQDNNDAGSSEAAFNSDDTSPIEPSNPELDLAKSQTVLLANIPVTIVGGVQYYEFRIDLNEANSDPNGQISLDKFIIKTAPATTTILTKTDFDTLTTLRYDMDAAATGGDRTLLLSEVSTGSGTDDYAVFVPVANFTGVDPATTNLYLYVQFGAEEGDYQAQAGFEEISTQNAGSLTGTKFLDSNGNGIKDGAEGGMANITIFIDNDLDGVVEATDNNGVLDAGERSTVTDANGNYTFYGVPLGTWQIDEVVPAGYHLTTGNFETAVIASAGQVVSVDPIGNAPDFVPNPGISLDKQVSVDGGTTWFDIGDVADNPSLLGSAAADLEYRFVVTNTGNVNLTNVTLSDVPSGAITGLNGNIGTLTPGQSVTITIAGNFFAGQNTDTATVTTAEGVSDTDVAGYFGATPGVTIDKGVSGDGVTFYQTGSDTTVPTILVGQTVFFQGDRRQYRPGHRGH